MELGDQCHAPAALPPGKRPGTHCIGVWVGPRAVWKGAEKSRPPPPEFDPLTFQPVASCYTDWAIDRGDIQNILRSIHIITNKGSQQMQRSIYIYCIRSHPTCFGPPTGPSSGVSWAASSCRNLAHAVLLYIHVSADGGLVADTRIYSNTAWAKWRHELAAQETPDDGPIGGPKHVGWERIQ
jgi:hypothetical protein